jgi:hypothetical protein
MESHRTKWDLGTKDYIIECIKSFSKTSTFDTYFNQFMIFIKWAVHGGYMPWRLTPEDLHNFVSQRLGSDDV